MPDFSGKGSFGGPGIVWSPERLWRETGNPLIVWETIDQNLSIGNPIPKWCLEYLRRAASSIVVVKQKSLSPDAQKSAVWRALEFGRQGKESAYAKLAKLDNSLSAALETRERVKERRRRVAKSEEHSLRVLRRSKRRWDIS